MRIAVFGATGGVGSRVVEQAINRKGEYEVTAFVRPKRKEPLPKYFSAVQNVYGDVLNKEDVEQAVINQDAIISTLGVRKRGGSSNNDNKYNKCKS